MFHLNLDMYPSAHMSKQHDSSSIILQVIKIYLTTTMISQINKEKT